MTRRKPSMEDLLIGHETRDRIDRAMSEVLTERERFVVQGLFGYNGPPMTAAEMCRTYSEEFQRGWPIVSRQLILQKKQRAIEKLQAALGRRRW